MRRIHRMALPSLTTVSRTYLFIALGIILLLGIVFIFMTRKTSPAGDKQAGMKSKELVVASFQVPSEAVSAGETIEIPIILEDNGLKAPDEYPSAVSLVMQFPPEVLEITSITLPEKDPLMTVELTSPTIDNENGTATITYGIAPGQESQSNLPGTLAIITAKAKSAGNANLSFTKAQIAATQVDGDVGKGESATIVIE